MQKYLATTWRLWKLLKPFHKDFYFQLAFIIFGQASSILFIYLTSKLLDNIVNKSFQMAFSIIFVFFVLKLVDLVISFYVDKNAFVTLETNMQQYLQEYSFKKVFKLNPSQYTEDHSAVKLQVINRGESAADDIVSKLILELFPVTTQILFSLVVISFYSKAIFLISLTTLLISVFWSYKFSNYHRPFVKENMDNWDKFQKIRTESFQHLYLIKILSISERFVHNYLSKRRKLLDYHVMTWMKSIYHATKRRLFFTISRNISTTVLIYLAYIGEITVGGIYAVWQYINSAYDQVQTINRAMRQLPLRFVELDKYLEIIDKEPDFIEESTIKFVDGDITFTNFSFKYPKGDSDVLKDLNITLPRGKKIAFVGHSGSGKTTITRLLLRAYDYTEGSIKIGKRELKDIDAHSLRTAIGYVEQHVDLFDDTVKNNILFGVSEKNMKKAEKELESVAKLARIDEFYHRLGAERFDTQIGERGIKLSGGERQRIGIARAIIKNPSILIFDEATSALDTINEKYIKEAIDNVSRDRTTIIIAHRLSTVQNSDLIVVMDGGKIVAHGTHSALLESSPHYQDLVNHQLSE